MTPRAAARLPNFFLAGVPRAGTTSFYAYLGQHPDVYVSPVKEPGFFGAADLEAGRYGPAVLRHVARDRATLRPYLEGTPLTGPQPLVLDRELYGELFSKARDERAVGEGTQSYFSLPGAARAIRATVPEARLLFILRDPAERLYSQHLAALWHDPGRSFRERFQAAIATPAGSGAAALVDEGRFATNLERFFALFPRERIRIYLYEDYRADPRAVLRDAFAFLGVDPDFAVDLSRRENETLTPRRAWVHALRLRLWGNRPLSLLPRWARRALARGYRRPGSDVTMEPADRRLVIDYYAEEIARTARLIGRDLTAWLR
jgi:hypothetical protein